ncbi:alpha/beta hydrolase [Phycicoccus sp. BSK3Z-2]|uniref:Alpha/beta hydrolase n=1 Tax=Phycicoccus avicenniae TaxID=2828860 RepID=A0A941D8I5_9MICO|nr:alpha/beta hydrolase [Phycicoccus avicenniae]MBR7741867.1 alpha/beta hydrolase [Phycicoccus avicenniae]
MKHSSRQVVVDGHEIHVVEQGEGPVVLFCHGFPDTAETWRRQMQAVADAGFRAIALDMRGFGRSHAPRDVSQYTSLMVAGDLVGLLDVVGARTAVLVGHDWGADYVQRTALLRPDRVRAVVSLSIPFAPRGELSLRDDLEARGLGDRYYAHAMARPGGGADFEPASRSVPSVLHWLSASPPPDERWDPVDPRKHLLRESPVAVPPWADADYVAHTIREFERTGFDTGLNYYRAVQASFDLTPALKGAVIRQPSLYIWGKADGLCQFFHPGGASLATLRETQPGLRGQVAVDTAGHWVQHEAAEVVNRELVAFLTALDPIDQEAAA